MKSERSGYFPGKTISFNGYGKATNHVMTQLTLGDNSYRMVKVKFPNGVSITSVLKNTKSETKSMSVETMKPQGNIFFSVICQILPGVNWI